MLLPEQGTRLVQPVPLLQNWDRPRVLVGLVEGLLEHVATETIKSTADRRFLPPFSYQAGNLGEWEMRSDNRAIREAIH